MHRHPRPITRRRRAVHVLAALATGASSLAGIAVLQRSSDAAALSFNESFQGSTLADPSNWVLNNSVGSQPPCLTAATSTQNLANSTSIGPCATTDASGSGVLRLTSTATSQSGTLQYINALPTTAGLDITFKTAQWGGSGADGLSFYLKDGASTNYAPGSIGGTLGYANGGPLYPGVPAGLLGIGFDRFGNFASSFLGPGCANSGPGALPNSITIRSGDTSTNKDGSAGYCYLGGTASNGVSYSGATRAEAARKVRIVLDPSTSTTPKVKVYMSGADLVLPNMPTVEVDQPAEYKSAATFKFGFSAATGGSTDNHEIWELGITQAPNWCTVGYLAQGASTTVGGVTVTATTQQAKDATVLGGSLANYYWHDATEGKVQTVWSFSTTLKDVRITTLAHDDGSPADERYDFTGKDTGSTTVLSEYIVDKNVTETYQAAAPMKTLQVDLSPSTGGYGSLVKLEIGTQSSTCIATCDFIPFGAQGSTVTAGATSIAVTSTSAVNWGSGSYRLFQSNGRQRHVLTFTPPITELLLQTAYHADSPGGVENFAFTMQDADGVDVFTTNVKNVDTTKVYGFASPVKTLIANFTPQNNTVNFGSLVRYKVPSGPGACGPATTPPPPPVVTADSGHVYYGKTTPTIGSSVAPTSTVWTTSPTCNVYAPGDTGFTTPLSGVLEPGEYVTHCKDAVSNPVLTVTYQDGTFVVDDPSAITAASYTGDDALTYPGTIPTIDKTIDAELVPDLTTQPTCAVFSEDWGGFDVPTALSGPLDAGTYVTRCHSAVADEDPDRYIRYIAGELVVDKATTSTAYNGDDFVLAGSTSLNLGNTLTAPAGCTGTVTYSLDDNPTTATVGDGPYTITSPASTSGWLAGAYVITVSYPGDENCEGSTSTATITSYTDGAGWGGGWYSSGGKNTFGFVVQSFERNKSTPAYTKGQVAWQSANWRFKGTLNAAYTDATKTKGTASGSGSLWYWNKSGATGTGVWVKATTTDTTVTITYEATTPSTKKRAGNPGKFAISFSGTPTTGVPSLPTMANPLTINEGNIKVA